MANIKVTPGGGLRLTDEGIALVKRAISEDIKRAKAKDDQPAIAAGLVIGELSENVNWMGIETIGNYISPIGDDNKHIITVSKGKRHKTVAEFECTNAIYSEWVMCLCETMWHTEQKVLEDIHGNKYPVGDMCEYQCRIRYV